jgi:DNA modification methylase
MEYQEFLSTKKTEDKPTGLDKVNNDDINPMLFDFQRDIVKWSLKRGRSAIFADCGLGKTPMQLEWADQVPGDVLILAPLAVAQQTIREANKFNIKKTVKYCRSQFEVESGITITNYEMLDKFDPSKFRGVVLDESSILKAYSGKIRNQIINSFTGIDYKLACTATPAPNDFMELGNHAEFLGVMKRTEMLAMYFINDCDTTQKWRLKKHAESEFWKWVCSWAVMIRKPSDLGYDDKAFSLPPIKHHEHIIKTDKKLDGELFSFEAQTLQERQRARKETIKERCQIAADMINNSKERWLVWCNLNDESRLIHQLTSESVEVTGSDKQEKKEKNMLAFSGNQIKCLVTKPKIAGFGMNWQNCHNIAFVGLSDSYEQYYQAVRRCWRFGQKNEVNVHLITADIEGAVVKNIQRKEKDAMDMAKKMVENMHTINEENIRGTQRTESEYKTNTITGKGYELFHGDCIDYTESLEENSIDYSIFSPPFPELYTYSNSDRDMGNAKNYNEFFKHFPYLIKNLFKIIKQGRLVSIHCMDIPQMKEKHGVIGLFDFPGDLIRSFQKEGFIYHSRVTIWKNPLVEATRTKAIGLMHKQLCKDSAMSRQGIPDTLLTFRVPGDNAAPINNDTGLKEFIGEDEPTQRGLKYSHEVWRRYASPVWMDINQSNTLQYRSARDEKDEKHICPLQLDVIGRCIELWSNPGDVVFSPFTGIGSELYQALKMDRKAKGSELKESYFTQAVKNLNNVVKQGSLF